MKYDEIRFKEKAIDDIFSARPSSEKIHPGFPEDPIHAAAIVAEENGELQQAVLQWVYEGGRETAVYEEAIQTAAMALRFLFNMRRMKPIKSAQVPEPGAGS